MAKKEKASKELLVTNSLCRGFWLRRRRRLGIGVGGVVGEGVVVVVVVVIAAVVPAAFACRRKIDEWLN